jgi:hypothetical protein
MRMYQAPKPAQEGARPMTMLGVCVRVVPCLAVVVLVILSGERSAVGGTAEPAAEAWRREILTIEAALARGDLWTAGRARHAAEEAALRSRGWEGMLAVGHAALSLGEAAGSRRAGEADARRAYLTALFRARAQASLDGIVRAGEAFAFLGDRAVVVQCVRIAAALPPSADDPAALAALERLSDRVRGARHTWLGARP